MAAGASPSPGSPTSPPPMPGAPAAQASGQNPATTPVANRGTEQMALMAIGMHARQIEQLMVKLPFGSDQAKDISEAVNKIRKHVKDQSAPPGVEKTQVDSMQLAARQNAMRLQQMRQQAMQGASGGGAPPAGTAGGTPAMAA